MVSKSFKKRRTELSQKEEAIAFYIPQDFDLQKNGFNLITCHTDSPCLKLAPVSLRSQGDFQILNILPYGGGMWHSYFDRDLTLAGNVITLDQNFKLKQHPVHIQKPLLRIPSLAIHFHRERQKLEFNEETNMKPIFATEVEAQLNREQTQKGDKHPKGLLRLISEQINYPVEQIIELDLWMVDTKPACVMGLYDEFISAPRTDNLVSTFNAFQSLLAVKDMNLSNISIVIAFDNEEIGSETQQGAISNLLSSTLERIYNLIEGERQIDAFNACMARSFCISSDNSHALHPNYQENYQLQGAPNFHKGCVIKFPSYRGNYATDGAGSSFIQKLAEKHNIPIQLFFMKADKIGGSTVGPLIAAKTGIKTVDVGNCQLGMHCIREFISTKDLGLSIQLLTAFLQSQYADHDL